MLKTQNGGTPPTSGICKYGQPEAREGAEACHTHFRVYLHSITHPSTPLLGPHTSHDASDSIRCHIRTRIDRIAHVGHNTIHSLQHHANARARAHTHKCTQDTPVTACAVRSAAPLFPPPPLSPPPHSLSPPPGSQKHRHRHIHARKHARQNPGHPTHRPQRARA